LMVQASYSQAIGPDKVVEIIKNKKSYPNYSLVTAHRGYWKTVPEGSTAAFDSAITIGADMVEADVRLTKDNMLVVFHDPCLDRLTSETGPINQYSWADIKDLRLKDVTGRLTTYKLLSLEEAIQYIGPRIVISLDIKVKGKDYDLTFIESVKLFRKYKILNHLIIKGNLSPDALENLLTAAGTNLGEMIYTPVIYNNPGQLQNFNAFLGNNQIHGMELMYKRDSDPLLIDKYVERNVNAGKVTGSYSFWPELCGGIIYQDEKTCKTSVWAYNFINGITPNHAPGPEWDAPGFDPDKYFFDDGRGDWDWLTANGTDFIITDRPALLIQYLTAIGRRRL